MICKHCGMDSATTDVCSFCGQPLGAAPADNSVIKARSPVPAMLGASGKTHHRPAPAFPAKRSKTPASPLPPATSRGHLPTSAYTPPTQAAPRIIPASSDQLAAAIAQLKPISDQDASAKQFDASAAAETALASTAIQTSEPTERVETSGREAAEPTRQIKQAAPVEEEEEEFVPPNTKLITLRYSLAVAMILIAAGGLTYIQKFPWGLPLVAAEFLGGILLPLMQVVPWADEDPDDLRIYFFLNLTLGPLAGFLVYIVISFLRQTVNPALVGCFLITSLSLISIQLGLGNVNLQNTIPWVYQHLSEALVEHLLFTWSGLIAIIGWYSAGFFRRLDE